MTQRVPALRGGLFALVAAALFGVSTPLVQRAAPTCQASVGWHCFREVMDRRVWAAMLLPIAGGMLVVDRGLRGGLEVVGLLAVLATTASWGVDNTLSRAVCVSICWPSGHSAWRALDRCSPSRPSSAGSWPSLWVISDRSLSWGMAVGGGVMVGGVLLHLAE